MIKSPSFFRTYSPKGDWNTTVIFDAVVDVVHVFQNLFPERGLKPQESDSWYSTTATSTVFQNLFPERGLKQDNLLGCVEWLNESFSEPIPRKGTETKTNINEHDISDYLVTFFRTYSPKGDWNEGKGRYGNCALPLARVFQNLFPERGLKRWLAQSFLIWASETWFFRTYSPKGDWNCDEFLGWFTFLYIMVFQNLFPERGLKLQWMVILLPNEYHFVFQNLFPERGLKRH